MVGKAGHEPGATRVRGGLRTATRIGPDATAGGALLLVYTFWILKIFEVDWFASAMTGGPFYRIPTILAPVLVVAVLARTRKEAIYWPLIVFVIMHIGASLLAENAGYARDALKFMLFMVLLFAGSVTFLDTPGKTIVVLKLYLLNFVWFGVQGIPGGTITWHPLLGNEDSYGPLMVMAMAFSYFFALAVSSRGWKWLARAVFLLSVLGVVVSFARGAALAAGAVLLYILWRSPHRARAIGGGLVALAVLLPVASMILPLDAYLEELGTVSDAGEDVRAMLWRIAWDVFLESPVVGVGAGNFGVVASMITSPDAGMGDPARLYRFGTHNAHVQILAEEGIVGIALWGGMIFGFFRRIRRLRTEDAQKQWIARGGTSMNLGMIAFGLEGAMVAFLGTSLFYNQLYIHWIWSLLMLAYVITGLTSPAAAGDGKAKVARH